MIVSTPTALVAAAPTLLRKGLTAILRERWPQLRLTLTADATQVAELTAHIPFGLLLLDEGLIGRALPDLLAHIHRVQPSLRLVLLTEQRAPSQPAADPVWLGSPLRLPRHVPPHILIAALAAWLDGLETIASSASRYSSDSLPDSFSRRELEVLRLVVADYCNEEIANQLFINVRTVESHRRNLLQKAGTRTLVGLAARAVREGWVA